MESMPGMDLDGGVMAAQRWVTPLDAALWFASRGVYVLPIYAPDADGTCTCSRPGCTSGGKHPITPNGSKDAMLDQDQIRTWWTQYPDANLGLALKPSEIVVIDIDNPDYVQDFERANQLPATFVVESQPGHRHYYYRRGNHCPAIRVVNRGRYDILGDGMLIGPPSRHRSGTQYTVRHDWDWSTVQDLPMLPRWAEGELIDAEGRRAKPVDVDMDHDVEVDSRVVYQRVAPRLPESIRTLIEHGHMALEETASDRSLADSKVCTALVGEGCSDQEIVAIYQEFPIGTQGKFAERGSKYLATTIGNARNYRAAGNKSMLPVPWPSRTMIDTERALVDPDIDDGSYITGLVVDPVIELPEEFITEHRVAEALVDHVGAWLRYVPERGRWFIWDGRRWVLDEGTTGVRRLVIDTVRSIERGIQESEANWDQRRDLLNKALSMENSYRVQGIVKQAETVRGAKVHFEAFDANPWLLNVPNGTLDLRTGTLREHQCEDLLTQMASVPFDAEALAPAWVQFLEQIFLGDQDLIRYVQRMVGYCLTGDVSERAFFVLYGGGRNGKSVFVEVLKAVLGDYAGAVNPDALLMHRETPHPTDIARLRGKRLAYAQEAPEGRRLNEALIKAMTGGDTVTARHMHQDPWEMKPTFKLWLSTNSRPIVRETGTAMWDRIKIIPFLYTVPEGKEEKRHILIQRMAGDEGPGVLRWAVDGYRDYLEHGLREPQVVRDAISEYRGDMDVLGRFLDECCAAGDRNWVKTGDLYSTYADWCRNNGEDPWTSQTFGRRLGERGFQGTRKTVIGETTRVWVGLKLK